MNGGDFLAGSVAPLALLWLVIGYFQQGEELRFNTETLRLQQEELRQQVAATRELAENSERQAEASETIAQQSKFEHERVVKEGIIKIQPDFRSQGGAAGGGQIKTTMINSGLGDARDCRIVYDGPHTLEFHGVMHIWPVSEQHTLLLIPNIDAGSVVYPIIFFLVYIDGL